MRQPAFFLPHGGGPCFFMEWDPPDAWDHLRSFLQDLPTTLPALPRALLVISAHWEAPQFTVQDHPAPPLLFDYYGFPEHTYRLTWPAPGAPELASRVTQLLSAAGLPCASDLQRGFDHGVFVPLKVAFPKADIPCLQLSLRADLDPAAHVAAGRALAPLRDEGVLIIGSGNSYHNMAMFRRMLQARTTGVQGVEFDRWLTAAATHPDARARYRLLLNWARAPGARDAAPREEHLIPLHVVAGAAGEDAGAKIFEDSSLGAIQSAFRFG